VCNYIVNDKSNLRETARYAFDFFFNSNYFVEVMQSLQDRINEKGESILVTLVYPSYQTALNDIQTKYSSKLDGEFLFERFDCSPADDFFKEYDVTKERVFGVSIYLEKYRYQYNVYIKMPMEKLLVFLKPCCSEKEHSHYNIIGTRTIDVSEDFINVNIETAEEELKRVGIKCKMIQLAIVVGGSKMKYLRLYGPKVMEFITAKKLHPFCWHYVTLYFEKYMKAPPKKLLKKTWVNNLCLSKRKGVMHTAKNKEIDYRIYVKNI